MNTATTQVESTVTKSKVSATNRICLKGGEIYCSSKIVHEVRHLLVRLEKKYAPKKDHYDELWAALRRLVITKPEHFPASTRVRFQ